MSEFSASGGGSFPTHPLGKIRTTGIQSGPDAYDKSRLVMAFLIVLGVTETCSFRLVLEYLQAVE